MLKFELRLSAIAAACVIAAAAPAAKAAMLTSSYSGTVSGYLFQPQILDAFPLGTTVSWEFTFDDSFSRLPSSGDVFGTARHAIDGWLQVGADRIELEEFGLSSYSYETSTGNILNYRTQISGTGPLIFPGGADFFGLFMTLSPTLDAQSNVNVGYAYHPSSSVTNYGYLTVEGAGRIRPAEIPAPATTWLLLPGALWVALRKRVPGR